MDPASQEAPEKQHEALASHPTEIDKSFQAAEKVDEKQDEGADAKAAGRGRTTNVKSQLAAHKSEADPHHTKKLTEAEVTHYFWRIQHMLEELYDLEKHMTEEEKVRFRERLDVILRRKKNEEERTFWIDHVLLRRIIKGFENRGSWEKVEC